MSKEIEEIVKSLNDDVIIGFHTSASGDYFSVCRGYDMQYSELYGIEKNRAWRGATLLEAIKNMKKDLSQPKK